MPPGFRKRKLGKESAFQKAKACVSKYRKLVHAWQTLQNTVQAIRERKEGKKRLPAGRQGATTLKSLVSCTTSLAIAIIVILLAGTLIIRISSLTLPMILTGAGSPLLSDTAGRTTILLIGQGDGDHDGIDLTDSIQVVSIDPKGTGISVLLSLPRDLYFLQTEVMGPGRLNALWRDYRNTLIREEGMEYQQASLQSLNELKEEVGRALGIPVHYAAKVDFTAFSKLVDAIGGIDIDVPETILDTEYPGPNWTFETFEIAAGPQNLDGETALKYARSRSTSSDFERSERQQLILQSLISKAEDMKLLRQPSKIKELLGILSDHIETDLTIRELLTLAGAARKIDPENILSSQIHNINGLYGEPLLPGGILYSPPRDLFSGASVLLPVSIPEFPVTWKHVQAFAELLFNHRRIFVPKAPTVAVLNGGSPPGSAADLAKELKKFGFRIANIENAPAKVERTQISGADAFKEAAKTLAAVLQGEYLQTPPDVLANLSQDGRGDVTIVLGPDYTFEPLQDGILALKQD